MNEFEWRRQLRELRQPLAPGRDLWASIEASLDEAERVDAPPAPRVLPRRRRWLLGVGLAASVVLAAGLGWHLLQPPTTPTVASAARTGWKPADPRLAGAAIELDAARMELQLAIQQAPDSAALQRLLTRTELQQTQLRRLASHQAG
ncbi:hypothetical protein ACFPPA_14940 [Rhodanobacter ginsengisoli]|uniref:Anti-sigma factor n=1 Tax=Rhodanobacter ginsengisoli TaxID=418646 RepID=A0ABW0QVX9_9GAMM